MPVLGPMSAATSNNYEDDSLPRNTVHEVVVAPLYAVKFTDGHGKTQMRFVAFLGDTPFLLPMDVSGNARAAQRWFADQMREKLGVAPKKVRRKRTKKEENEATDTKPHKPVKMKPLNVEAI